MSKVFSKVATESQSHKNLRAFVSSWLSLVALATKNDHHQDTKTEKISVTLW
jgi:hypothetical protein